MQWDRCHSNCATCAGPELWHWLACHDNNASVVGTAPGGCWCNDTYYDVRSGVAPQNCSLWVTGNYVSDYSCLICPSICTECTSAVKCSAWLPNAVVKNEFCVWIDGKYYEEPTCVDCHEECLTCDGGTKTNCTSCVVDRLLINREWTEETECPDGQYQPENTNECHPCGETCLTWETTMIQCILCNVPKYERQDGVCDLKTCETG